MRRVVFLSLLIACAELRAADKATPTPVPPTDDASTTHPVNGGDDDDGTAIDGGEAKDATVVDPTKFCDASCAIETVVDFKKSIGPLVIDDTNVYFTALGQGTYSCRKSGCVAPTQLVNEGHFDLTLANKTLYWSLSGKIVGCATAGCNNTPTLLYAEDTGVVDQVRGDGQRLVWAVKGSDGDSVHTCVTTECTEDKLVEIPPGVVRTLRAADGRVVWINLVSDVESCKSDVPCPASTHLGELGNVELAIAAGTAFWMTEANELVSCPVGGCASKPSVLTKPTKPRALAADATHVYWFSTGANVIQRCPHSGCETPETVATNVLMDLPHNLAFDDTYVYWNTNAGVFRRRK